MKKPIKKSVRISEEQNELLQKYFDGSVHTFLDKYLTKDQVTEEVDKNAKAIVKEVIDAGIKIIHTAPPPKPNLDGYEVTIMVGDSGGDVEYRDAGKKLPSAKRKLQQLAQEFPNRECVLFKWYDDGSREEVDCILPTSQKP